MARPITMAARSRSSGRGKNQRFELTKLMTLTATTAMALARTGDIPRLPSSAISAVLPAIDAVPFAI
jgi:hypothetical protein